MKTSIIAVLIVIVAAAGWYFYRAQYQAPTLAPAPQSSGDLLPAPSSVAAKEVVVDITASGFSPAEVRIKAGDTVKFINKDTKKRWPASGVHPTHLLCPGFDAKQGINAGESYSHTFTDVKTCPMHDHLFPIQFGKIIVE
ncbi:MAG: hypothetical protein UX24_C0031G0006 [Candidatus Giovannonibacteria bacterium GW2011_GWB1_45_9b]|uniref:EfeO-type cupredoxin-like domain-containing protein n=5 Tax=Candidatus Giovannoniibacteriota TaxID=1752738 RepID=A0A1F5XCK4_9BACT|nr:MAG: hypothetical protein UW74_C0016G0002 [Candidatus Giovannonibacteria bacterium GW2011_GWC2_44_8]KKU04347.1 MAG: hypothetical protein UX06_C0021G0005 [Candidatus Giovannonibacteria bacterium GW2011_GWA2_45_21]KKU15774.1 MAG: hypothetical protein UX24_C0031G0006 [Candidatus Giovannonibacteria bacterium GW2011_GWB1_45_9b]OGF74061.1 MAG: hypothetical protein A2W57_02520 [Candidatus Giovannonibacteria bacterium RIFCSPHIGHO2_02_43_16]OGF85590.1 MAG: hypothetical protein A2Z63_00355 [Candidatus